MKRILPGIALTYFLCIGSYVLIYLIVDGYSRSDINHTQEQETHNSYRIIKQAPINKELNNVQ